MKNKLFYSFLLLVCSVTILAGCSLSSFSATEQSDIEIELQENFARQGYKGEVAIQKFDRDFNSGDYFIYDYTEKVEGKKLTFTEYVDFQYDDYQEGETIFNLFKPDEIDGGIDGHIKSEAMWKQGYVKKQLKQVEKTFEKMEDESLQLTGAEGYQTFHLYQEDGKLKWEEVLAGQQEMLGVFRANQQQNLPVNGYYNVDVQTYLKKHVLQISVDFELEVEEIYKFEEEGEEEYKRQFVEKVKMVDYSRFWDGYYIVSFSLRDRAGSTSGAIWNSVVVDVQDGKLVRTFDSW